MSDGLDSIKKLVAAAEGLERSAGEASGAPDFYGDCLAEALNAVRPLSEAAEDPSGAAAAFDNCLAVARNWASAATTCAEAAAMARGMRVVLECLPAIVRELCESAKKDAAWNSGRITKMTKRVGDGEYQTRELLP